MTDISIAARRAEIAYWMDMMLGGCDVVAKLDSGEARTVISAQALNGELTEERFAQLKSYSESHSIHKRKFISASGHSFYGYPVVVHDVEVGGSVIPFFLYYLVIENKRDIALLGFDFIDRCQFSHEPEGDIILTKFDESGYSEIDGAMENDEVIAFMDSLGE